MIEMDNQPIVEDQPATDDGGIVPVKVSEGKPSYSWQHKIYPQFPRKLAQQIWDMDFVEIEEFLPSNRTVQALEISGLARDGTVFQVPQARRVADITSWIWCFTLYVAVMAR